MSSHSPSASSSAAAFSACRPRTARAAAGARGRARGARGRSRRSAARARPPRPTGAARRCARRRWSRAPRTRPGTARRCAPRGPSAALCRVPSAARHARCPREREVRAETITLRSSITTAPSWPGECGSNRLASSGARELAAELVPALQVAVELLRAGDHDQRADARARELAERVRQHVGRVEPRPALASLAERERRELFEAAAQLLLEDHHQRECQHREGALEHPGRELQVEQPRAQVHRCRGGRRPPTASAACARRSQLRAGVEEQRDDRDVERVGGPEAAERCDHSSPRE